MVISTLKDCEDVLNFFDLKGSIEYDYNKVSVIFNIVKPKFKWFNVIKKVKYKNKIKKLTKCICDNMSLAIFVNYNFIEEQV